MARAIYPARQALRQLARTATLTGPMGLVLVALLLLLGFGPAARAGDIVIVTSSDATPYVQAQTELKKQFAQDQREARSVPLAEVSKKGLDAALGKADLVVAVGTNAAVWLHGHLPEATPLVYCMVADPAAAGLAGGHVSYGVSTDLPLKTQIDLIAEALPKAHTLGILYHSNTPEGQRQLKNLQETLPKDWELKPIALDNYGSVADAIEALMKQHVDVVWTAPDPTIYNAASVRSLLLASLRTNTPVFGYSAAFVKAGALIGIGVDPQAQGQQTAALALQILKSPGDTKTPRVNPPESFQIAANLIVASSLSIELPQDLVKRAAYTFKEER